MWLHNTSSFLKFDADSDSKKNQALEIYRYAKNSLKWLEMISFAELMEYGRIIHHSFANLILIQINKGTRPRKFTVKPEILNIGCK